MIDLPRRHVLGGIAIAAAVVTGTGLGGAAKAQTPPSTAGLDQLVRIMSKGTGQADGKATVVTIIEGPIHTQDEPLYRFLGSSEFLDAACRANIRTIANELPVEFEPQIQAFQSAVRSRDNSEIDRASRAFQADMAELTSFANAPAAADREKEAIFSYVKATAKCGIDVTVADNLATDQDLNALERRYFAAQAQYSRAIPGSPMQAEIGNSITDLSNQIGAERFTERVNRPIVAALAQAQQARGGNMLVVYGAGHGEIMQTLFREAGYKTALVAVHTSLAGRQDDLSVAPGSYRGDTFLLDTRTFLDAPASSVLPARPRSSPTAPTPR